MIKIGPSIAGRSRATARCVSFFAISCQYTPESPELAETLETLSTPGNERVPFRLHFARAFSHSDSAANLSSGPLNIDLQSRTLGPNHLFIPISFLLSNPRNINARLDYDRAGRKFIHYYHIYSRSENSCNSIFRIKDESCVYIPIFKMQLF